MRSWTNFLVNPSSIAVATALAIRLADSVQKRTAQPDGLGG